MKKKLLFLSSFLIFTLYPFFVNTSFSGEKGAKSGSVIFYEGKNKILCSFKVEFAITEFEQTMGLMFRKSMDKHKGMLFVHKDDEIRHYWMKNTYIPLDMIFIDSNKTVVDIYKDARPLDETTISSKAKARYVLEINSGEADNCGIKRGTKVKITIDK
ncbi:MAG TPA: DUF192 domain-containing protein [Syntrophorhabdaceae bacterium]|nr:DUF192 domain-containing protein [Syntrophorhabdaceae bacterium]